MCKMSCLVALFTFSNKSMFFFLENVNNEPIVKKQNKQPRNLVDGEKTVTFPVSSLFIYYIITGVVWIAIGEVSNRRKSCTACEYTSKQSSINQSS